MTMSFRDELFSKIGADSDQQDVSDPQKLILLGDQQKQSGNVGKATELYNNAVKSGLSKSEKFSEQKQYRSAAESYYITSMAYERLSQMDKVNELYSKVATNLLEAANTYLNMYKEFRDGALCATLSGLVYILQKRTEDAKKVYEEYTTLFKQKDEEGIIPGGSDQYIRMLWIVGYIIQALSETNHNALQEAQTLISSKIRPILDKAKLSGIEPLLDHSLNYVISHFESKIKLPIVTNATEFPKDMVINEIYNAQISVQNIGEGEAHDGVIQIEDLINLEILKGSLTESFEKLTPGETIAKNIEFRYQSADSQDVKLTLKGKVRYKDMLNNEQIQYIGPISLAFNAISKKVKLTRELDAEKTKSSAIKSITKHPDLPTALYTPFEKTEEVLFETLKSEIENENFEVFNSGLSIIKSYRKTVEEYISESGMEVKPLLEKINQDRENYASERVAEREEKLKETHQKEIDNINQTHQQKLEEKDRFYKDQESKKLVTQKDQLEKAHDEALKAKLVEQKDQLDKLKAEEINNLKKEHEQELQAQSKKLDKQLNLKLEEHEENLKEDFQKEKEVINQKNEEAFYDLKNTYEKEIEDKLSALRKQLTDKFEKQIKEEKGTVEDNYRREMEGMKQEYELKIKTINSQHKKQMDELKETYERRIAESKS
jgi:hypothetical protein